MMFKNFTDFCIFFSIEDIIKTKDFELAMTHSSVSKTKNYERFEFLGDTILNFCISRMIFEKYKNMDEGDLSKKKSFLITREVCRHVAKDINLEGCIKFAQNTTITAETIIADVVESLICVIYMNFGMDKVYEIITTLFEPYDNANIKDYKMELQEYTQKHYRCLPLYSIINKTGSEHNPVFFVDVNVGSFHATGTGHNKKQAEKDGAKRMLLLLVGKSKQSKNNKK